jgi:hypothetical protein
MVAAAAMRQAVSQDRAAEAANCRTSLRAKTCRWSVDIPTWTGSLATHAAAVADRGASLASTVLPTRARDIRGAGPGPHTCCACQPAALPHATAQRLPLGQAASCNTMTATPRTRWRKLAWPLGIGRRWWRPSASPSGAGGRSSRARWRPVCRNACRARCASAIRSPSSCSARCGCDPCAAHRPPQGAAADPGLSGDLVDATRRVAGGPYSTVFGLMKSTRSRCHASPPSACGASRHP